MYPTTTTTPGGMLAHAIAYAQAGIAVLPLVPGQKHPATKHGKDDATTDLEKIERWWTRRPQCNIGVRPQHGLAVLDIDVQHGGPALMAALLDHYGPLPSTWIARTGQGGQHIWLRCDGPFRGKLGTGVDIKSHSGYLVAPPSIHPNGNRYEWLNDEPIAWAPEWLRPMIASPERWQTVAVPGTRVYGDSGLIDAVANAPAGLRNKLLYWAARRAVESGTFGQLRHRLEAAAIANGLTEYETRLTLKSAAAHMKDCV